MERETPANMDIQVILDNYAAHRKDKVRAWLARHPCWTTSRRLPASGQRRRRLLRQTNTAQAQARRLPFRRRTPGRHQPLSARIQYREPATIHLESQSRRHHRRSKQKAPNIGLNPLAIYYAK